MPVAIPNTEPDFFTAGETVQWTRTLPDYPATSWTLKYAFQASGKALIPVTADSDGTDFLVTIQASVSGNYAPGAYILTPFVEQGSTRHAVGRISVNILPSPLAALGATHASRMLTLIQCALEGRIPNGLEKTDIDGQTLERILVVDLNKMRIAYEAKVANEGNAASMAAGLGNRRNHFARFTNVR